MTAESSASPESLWLALKKLLLLENLKLPLPAAFLPISMQEYPWLYLHANISGTWLTLVDSSALDKFLHLNFCTFYLRLLLANKCSRNSQADLFLTLQFDKIHLFDTIPTSFLKQCFHSSSSTAKPSLDSGYCHFTDSSQVWISFLNGYFWIACKLVYLPTHKSPHFSLHT